MKLRSTRRPSSSPWNRERRRQQGFSLFVLVILLLLMVCLAAVFFWYKREQDYSDRCHKNLTRIYAALEMYELNLGELPSLAFYPADPLRDDNSLAVVLSTRTNCRARRWIETSLN